MLESGAIGDLEHVSRQRGGGDCKRAIAGDLEFWTLWTGRRQRGVGREASKRQATEGHKQGLGSARVSAEERPK